MSELNPVTREEMYMTALLNGGGEVPEPVTREEMLYKAILDGAEPGFDPVTRKEMYLVQIAKNGGGSSVELLDKAVDLNFADGNQVVTAPDEQGYKTVMINKPATLLPSNIVEGVDIAGVVGNVATDTAVFMKVGTVTVSYTVSKVNLTGYEWYDKITADDIYIVPQAFTVFSTTEGETSGTITCGTYNFVKSYSNGILSVSRASVSGKVGIDFPADIYVYAELEENPLTASFIGVLNRTMANPVLPEGLTSIGYNAFASYTTLVNPILPESITEIGKNAFHTCTSLALTSLPAGITNIGEYAFHNCTNLALTSLPAGITNIEKNTFYACRNLALTSLPAGITSIGANAFYGCYILALTSLPAGITNIEKTAFNDCYGLTEITFNGTPETIESTAFKGCTNLLTINVPWAEGEVANAPWGATNAEIRYNYTEDESA